MAGLEKGKNQGKRGNLRDFCGDLWKIEEVSTESSESEGKNRLKKDRKTGKKGKRVIFWGKKRENNENRVEILVTNVEFNDPRHISICNSKNPNKISVKPRVLSVPRSKNRVLFNGSRVKT